MIPRKLLQLFLVTLISGMASIFTSVRAADLSYDTKWFPRQSPTTNRLWGVTHGNGLFVAVGEKGTILTSAGGGTWNTTTSPTSGDLFCVRYVNGLFMAGTTNGILVSSDGEHWSYRAIPVPAFGPRPSLFTDIAFGLGYYVAMTTSDGAVATALLSSTDGLNWTQRYSAAGPSFRKNGVTFGNGRFVAVQEPWAQPGEHRFLTSTNAADWTPSGPSFSALPANSYQPKTVSYGNGLFFAAGYVGVGPFVGNLYRSTNGFGWSVVGNQVFQGNFSGIAYGAGMVVAVGPWVLRVSTNNGATWNGNDPSNGTSANWPLPLDVTYGAGTFVAVGHLGNITQSEVVEEASPFFIITPTNQVVQRGTTANFRSRAGGSEPLSYQWYKNGLSLIDATNAALSITNVQPTDAGAYSIVVSGPFGSITNPPVTLAVSFVKIDNYAGLTIEGIPGRTYRVEYLNALEPSSDWHSLTNIVLPASPYIWIDYETPTVPKRFYRTSELP